MYTQTIFRIVNLRNLLILIGGWLLLQPVLSAQDKGGKKEKLEPAAAEFFDKKILPVLKEHCYECHSANATVVEGNLLLDTRAGLRKGGKSGPLFIPGQPGKSLIIK